MALQRQESDRAARGRHGVVWASLAVACLLGACSEPAPPRTFADFMEDRIARDGTLARCNEDVEATLYDIECANARRAAAAIALRRERERRETLERESEIKLAALRSQFEARERQAQAATQSAEAEQERAYEQLWDEADEAGAPAAASLEPVALPRRLESQPSVADTRPLLEEVIVPSRFGWRPAID